MDLTTIIQPLIQLLDYFAPFLGGAAAALIIGGIARLIGWLD